MPKLILVSRGYCHLCDDMLDALKPFRDHYGFDLDVLDVDQDAELTERYDELVPVLLGSRDGAAAEQICNYFLDQASLLAFLEK